MPPLPPLRLLAGLGPLALVLLACGGGEPAPPASSPTAPAGQSAGPGAPSRSAAASPREPTPSALAPHLPRFLARLELPAPGKPTGLARFDLDGDGCDEVLATTREPGALVLWRGTPAGPAVPPLVTPVGDWPLAPVVLATPAGPRVAVASQGGRELRLFLHDLERGAREVARLDLGAAPLLLAAGDLDRAPDSDGSPEVALVTQADEARRVVLFDVTEAGFAQRAAFALDAERPTALLVSSARELVIATQDGHELLFLDERGERARRALEDTDGSAIPRDLLEVDLDGDGDTELAVAGGDRAVWVLGLGATDGARAWRDDVPRAFSSTGLVPLALAAGNLGGDERPELAVLHWIDQNVGLLGDFAEGRPRLSLTPDSDVGQTPVAVLLADADGDGAPDLVVANRDARRVSLMLGTGFAERGRPVFYSARQTPTGRDPVRLASGDLDGDGLPEIVTLNASESTVSLLPNNYVLTPGARVPVLPGGRDVELLDVDGDGALDVAVLAQGARGGELGFLRGDGRGGAAAVEGPEGAGGAFATVAVGRSAARMAVGRVHASGRHALAIADPDGASVHLFAPREGGGLAAPRSYSVPGAPRDVCFVPRRASPGASGTASAGLLVAFDGEQGAALGWIALDAEPAQAWRALPAVFGERGASGGVAAGAAATDLDGDGQLDLVLLARGVRDNDPGHVGTLLARGGGDGWRVGPRGTTGLAPSSLATGDLDGDGRGDLAVTAQNSHQVNWWLVRGEPEALELARQADLGAHSGPLDLVLADLDGNGEADLVVANAFSDDVSSLYQIVGKR